ncbi:MAG: hypothetical protein AAF901_11005, partial [Bacteroidota bacterium]
MKYFSVIFLFLLTPQLVDKNDTITSSSSNSIISQDVNTIERIRALGQQLLFINMPNDNTGQIKYLRSLLGLSDVQVNIFINKFRQVFDKEVDFLDVKDPYAQLSLRKLLDTNESTCTIPAGIKPELDHLYGTIKNMTKDSVFQELQANGVSGKFLSQRAKEALNKDLETMKSIINGKQQNNKKGSIGGDYNRFIMMMWEIAPYLEDLKTAQSLEEFRCLFAQKYIQARQLNESIQVLAAFIRDVNDEAILYRIFG